MDDECIFCKLAKDNPKTIFDDGKCYVIPDRFPSEFGHLLVVSKDHHENVLAAPDETVGHMFIVAKSYGLKMRERLGASGLTITTNTGRDAGQIIFHLHIHVVPKYPKKIEGFVKHRELSDDDAKRLKDKLSN
ncbi:MAG: HIT family protein [Candidatus Micrarchaeota archaeon]|nr:HIT family protein [Candidatus Micrarchaeota archaeon]